MAAPASRTRTIVQCAMSIALMAVAAWITVPIGPIPFTLQTLAVMFVVFSLEPRAAFASIAGYLVLGALGLPIFAGFKGGLAALLGPTGGFIVGFLVAGAVALAVGAALRGLGRRPSRAVRLFGAQATLFEVLRLAAMGIAFLVVLYAFGWMWLVASSGLSLETAFVAAVAPFVPIDALKMVVAAGLSQAVRSALRTRTAVAH